METAWKAMADKLPRQPSDQLQNDVLMDIYDSGSLGGAMILYHREAVVLREDIRDLMDPEDLARRERMAKRRWGARCTCTNCGDDFIAGYVSKKGRKGIVLAEGDDGMAYSGHAEPGMGANEYLEGEMVVCPFCWTEAEVTHRAQLRQGRTYQILQAEVVNVEAYTAVMYWLVSRHVADTGYDRVLFLPHAALLVDLEGRLRRFRAKRVGNEVRDILWTPCVHSRDPMQITYYSWGAANNRQTGGWTFAYGPPLDGHTGEKTALDAYIGAGGTWPGAYLHLWQKYPQVENLMRNGFASAIQEAIDEQFGSAASYGDLRDVPAIPWVDWSEVKPNRMLHMDKDSFRRIRKKPWTARTAACWDRYRRRLCRSDMADTEAFGSCCEKVGVKAVDQLLEMMAAGWDDLQPVRVVRYLEKQRMLEDGVQHLIDYRKMLRDAGMAETVEALWPRDLTAAHERLTQHWAARCKAEYQLGFTSCYIKYRELEWTDGDLCIVVPRTGQQLEDEGRILRHCVGTYGEAHCSGRPIFFVRHYRRPERSYYTLQIDMTLNTPKRAQLHGYGNERHGPNKEYRHKIPVSVLNFCDRWEREVLLPWFRSQRKQPAVEPTAEKVREIA